MNELRWATPADIDAYYGGRPPQTVRAMALEIDGVIVGIGGLTSEKGLVAAFIDMRPEAKKHRKVLVRALRIGYQKLFIGNKLPIIAVADQNEPTAKGLLEHFGFEQTDNGVFVWGA